MSGRGDQPLKPSEKSIRPKSLLTEVPDHADPERRKPRRHVGDPHFCERQGKAPREGCSRRRHLINLPVPFIVSRLGIVTLGPIDLGLAASYLFLAPPTMGLLLSFRRCPESRALLQPYTVTDRQRNPTCGTRLFSSVIR